MHGITKVLVESVVASLNEKAERLGWARRYEFVAGSSAGGVKHVIQTRVPQLSHPTDLQRFNTLSKTHQYLLAMGQVLNDAVAERERQRATVTGEIPRIRAGYDPNARSLRAGEE